MRLELAPRAEVSRIARVLAPVAAFLVAFLIAGGVIWLMGRSPLAAMHGYDPAHPDMAGLLASNRPLPADVTHLAHLRSFLEHELDEASRPGHTLGAAS